MNKIYIIKNIFMKKILFSLTVIAVSASMVIGGTIAFFSDTEESKGNVFTAGSIDLKVDHTAQTYNGVDCKTCSVLLVSDPTNMVVAKNSSPFADPYPAVFLNPIHSAWTAQNEPSLLAAGAKWIWEKNPVKAEDATVDVTYSFEKTFEWRGPITGTDLAMAVGHDNTVDVYLNNVLIGQGTDIYGFRQQNMLHIPAANIIANTVQGLNVLKFVVMNKGQEGSDPLKNPAGLIYKFEINGNCEDDYFKSHCRLWGLKDLVHGDNFWNFNDVKPGDKGSNLISLHVASNEAWLCLAVANKVEMENIRTVPEIASGDDSDDVGELGEFLQVAGWYSDELGNKMDLIFGPAPAANLANIAYADSSTGNGPVQPGVTGYVQLEWCLGDMAIVGDAVACNGNVPDINRAQTDAFLADLKFYAVQSRNNAEFNCSGLSLDDENGDIY
jgi:predicted ribosomally synthesized peptide with SipW-like signal peptide